MNTNKYYADYDDVTDSYCVFDENGKAHGSFYTEWQAEKLADEMNEL